MAGGAYIRIKDGNIEIHAPGKVEQKAAVHPFMGPTSLPKEMPRLPTSELTIKKQFSLNDTHSGVRFPFQNYKITLEDGTEYKGKTNKRGETDPIESHIPQKALVQVLDNKTNDPVMMYHYSMLNGKEGYVYEDKREALPHETLDGQEAPKNHSSNTEQSLKPDFMNVPIYSFGMRKAKFNEAGICSTDGSSNNLCPLAGYPVVEQYYKAMGRLLDEFPWGEMFPEYVDSANVPLGDNELKDYYTELANQIKQPLIDAISSPLDADFAMPEALFPEMNFTSLADDVGGNFIAFYWTMNFPTKMIEDIAKIYVDSQKSGTQSMRNNFTNQLKLQQKNYLIDVLYHEVRHCQQHFWLAVYMEGFAKDFVLKADPASGQRKDAVVPQNVLQDCLRKRIDPKKIHPYIKNKIGTLSKAIKSRPYNQLALKRLAVCMLYTTYFNSKNPQLKATLERLSPGASDLVDKLAAQTFKNNGRNGQAIDYTLFSHAYNKPAASDPDYADKHAKQVKGYRMQPHEDDAYATGDIIGYCQFLEHKDNAEFPYYSRYVKVQKQPLPTDFSLQYPG